MNDTLREKLHALPDLPGCYLMKDAAGKIIYVGKAINLKNRVNQYFHGRHDPKTERMVANITDFEIIIVRSEAEALILEANLVKQYTPHFNILLRDDKHYPYLRLTMEEEWPRLMIARRAKPDGSKYFGPYPNAGAMHQSVALIRDIFPLRTCAGSAFRSGQRACLNAHIGRCLAPCEGRVSHEDYLQIVENVSLFLQGKAKTLLHQEEELMRQAAEEMRFEDAARHRDAAAALQKVQARQQIDNSAGEGDYDILAVAAAEDQAVVQVFFVRLGNVVGRAHFFLTNAEGEKESQLLYGFILEYYGGGQFLPATIRCNVLPAESNALAEMLSAQCGHKVELLVPQRGDKKQLLHLVEENARLVLGNYLNSRDRREACAAEGLDALRQVLSLSAAPRRMECYDISHVQGTNMVGSMVVFLNGVAQPKLYRHFKIKTLDHSDDFAALQEVLERRWKHGLEEKQQGKTDGFADFPDLLIIDGGKGQLSSVCTRLTEIGAQPAAIISLAKREEEVFLPGESEPLLLPLDSAGLQLLQQIRDEAHRFAITFHRKLRGKAQTFSFLDEVPGIGPKRRKSLLKCFGSLKGIKNASEVELGAAPGMTKQAAATLYAYLRKEQAQDAEK